MRRRLDRFGTRPRRRWRWRSWRSWWRKCWCQQQRRNFFERFGRQRRKRRYGGRRKSKQSERCCHVSRFSLYDGDSTYTDHPKQSEQPTEQDQRPARFTNCCTGGTQRWCRGDSTYTDNTSEQPTEDQRPARFTNCCTGGTQRWGRGDWKMSIGHILCSLLNRHARTIA